MLEIPGSVTMREIMPRHENNVILLKRKVVLNVLSLFTGQIPAPKHPKIIILLWSYWKADKLTACLFLNGILYKKHYTSQ